MNGETMTQVAGERREPGARGKVKAAARRPPENSTGLPLAARSGSAISFVVSDGAKLRLARNKPALALPWGEQLEFHLSARAGSWSLSGSVLFSTELVDDEIASLLFESAGSP